MLALQLVRDWHYLHVYLPVIYINSRSDFNSLTGVINIWLKMDEHKENIHGNDSNVKTSNPKEDEKVGVWATPKRCVDLSGIIHFIGLVTFTGALWDFFF